MKWLMKILLAMFLITPLQSWAFQNEPNGFRDLYWGESLEEIQQKRDASYWNEDQMHHTQLYAVDLREGESRYVAGIRLSNRYFIIGVWHNQLMEVALFFNDMDDNWNSLLRTMIYLYGEPQKIMNQYSWITESTSYYLSKNEDNGSICLLLFSRDLKKQNIQEVYG